VYSWGDNKFGQLGHGDRKTRNQPTRVEALDGKSIFHISAGKKDFLVCSCFRCNTQISKIAFFEHLCITTKI
jgi:alpha-tubulin suppressor-like RCC1 family protein